MDYLVTDSENIPFIMIYERYNFVHYFLRCTIFTLFVSSNILFVHRMARHTTLIFVTLALIPIIYSLYVPPGPRRVHPRSGQPDKRPFCNAFTGCGRKRSQLPPLTGVQELGAPLDGDTIDSNDLGSLLDLSAEPAVEDLSRQIMSEAKLWEAIQEANLEIMRQKQAQAVEQQQLQQAAGGENTQLKCALPSCITL